ncbi:MAG: ATP-binding cassette domain-containing protein [Planctomycetota bacterium]
MIASVPPIIRTTSLSRWFGPNCVIDNLDFEVPSGRVTALVGLNGAGKTTLMRIIMGFLDPTRGQCMTMERDSKQMDPETLSRIGYLVEGHYLPGWMRVSELERLCASSRAHWDHNRFADIIDHFAIRPAQRAGRISRGQRAGVSLACVLSAEPDVLVLDDPALGLDPISRRALNETLVDYIGAGGDSPRTILLSTHQLDDVERIADDIAVMISGTLWVHTSLDDFQSRVRLFHFAGKDSDDSKSLCSRIRGACDNVIETRAVGNRVLVTVLDADDSWLTECSRIIERDGEAIDANLGDRVMAYLARERERMLVNQDPSSRWSAKSKADPGSLVTEGESR